MYVCIIFSVRKLAAEQIAPLVRKMDDEHKIDDGIRQLLFDNGVRIIIDIIVSYNNIPQNIIHLSMKL